VIYVYAALLIRRPPTRRETISSLPPLLDKPHTLNGPVSQTLSNNPSGRQGTIGTALSLKRGAAQGGHLGSYRRIAEQLSRRTRAQMTLTPREPTIRMTSRSLVRPVIVVGVESLRAGLVAWGKDGEEDRGREWEMCK
jgi:hypothetical protein